MSNNKNIDVKILEDPPNPQSIEEIQSRDKLSEPNLPIELMVMLAGESKPQVEVDLVKTEEINDTKDTFQYEVKLSIQNPALGVHAFPPPMQIEKFIPKRELMVGQTDAYIPDHLPFRPVPCSLPKELHVRTVFPPENRKVFKDTAYPWSTIGRVETPNGKGTGVMVGPRHLLTAAHMIKWKSDGTTDWLTFAPALYDTSKPFGEAFATKVYVPEVIVDPNDGMTDDEYKHDYVVVVLNTRIGDKTGWMYHKIYSKSWNDQPNFIHVGYPWDLAGNYRPTYQKDIALKGSFWDSEDHIRIFHKADTYKGQSGGPFFGYWDSKPHVVAVQSAGLSDENVASGGAHMVNLIQRALVDYP